MCIKEEEAPLFEPDLQLLAGLQGIISGDKGSQLLSAGFQNRKLILADRVALFHRGHEAALTGGRHQHAFGPQSQNNRGSVGHILYGGYGTGKRGIFKTEAALLQRAPELVDRGCSQEVCHKIVGRLIIQKKEIEKAKGEDKFSDKAERLKNNIIIFKNTFSASKGNIKKMIVVKNINLNMDFGLGDAFATGISTGVLWGVLYSAFALICHLFTVEGHNFSIDPKFNKKIVKVSTNGVIYTRLADVIYTAFVVYKNYKEAKTLFEGYKITAASGDKSASKQEVSKN